MSSNAASIKFDVSIPLESIQAYFEGLAKVEAAKRAPVSSFDWLSLAPLAGLLLPLITDKISIKDESGLPEEFWGKPIDDKKSQFFISVLENLQKKMDSEDKKCEEKKCEDKKCEDKKCDGDVCCVDQCAPDCDCEESSCSSECPSSCCKKEESKDDLSLEEEESEVKKEEEPKSEAPKKKIRPSYKDEGIAIDLDNFSGALGSNEGFMEMMKGITPMMQQLMGGMSSFNQPQSFQVVKPVPKEVVKPVPKESDEVHEEVKESEDKGASAMIKIEDE